eukprot:scaffold11130_cov136-Isochrysis_galbana.AAC.4
MSIVWSCRALLPCLPLPSLPPAPAPPCTGTSVNPSPGFVPGGGVLATPASPQKLQLRCFAIPPPSAPPSNPLTRTRSRRACFERMRLGPPPIKPTSIHRSTRRYCCSDFVEPGRDSVEMNMDPTRRCGLGPCRD